MHEIITVQLQAVYSTSDRLLWIQQKLLAFYQLCIKFKIFTNLRSKQFSLIVPIENFQSIADLFQIHMNYLQHYLFLLFLCKYFKSIGINQFNMPIFYLIEEHILNILIYIIKELIYDSTF